MPLDPKEVDHIIVTARAEANKDFASMAMTESRDDFLKIASYTQVYATQTLALFAYNGFRSGEVPSIEDAVAKINLMIRGEIEILKKRAMKQEDQTIKLDFKDGEENGNTEKGTLPSTDA